MGNSEVKNKLYMAVSANQLDQISSILAAHPQLINETISDDQNTTALTRAAYLNRSHIITLLAEAGASMTATGLNKMSALMWAASKGHTECCIVLLKYSADIDQEGPHGMKAVDFAVLYGRYETAWLLVNSGAACSKSPEELMKIRWEMDLPLIDYAGFLLSLESKITPEGAPSFLVPVEAIKLNDPVPDPDETWKSWFARVIEFQNPPMVERSSLPPHKQPHNSVLGKILVKMGLEDQPNAAPDINSDIENPK